MRVFKSPHVLVEPNLNPPRTSDMADIVDAFRRNGLIRKVPGAITVNGDLFVHPAIFAEIQRKITRELDREITYGILGEPTIFRARA